MNYKNIIILFFAFTFIGCGYKSTLTYTQNEISSKVYVDVKIDISNAKNTVLIKDALIELLIGKLNVQVTNDKNKANTFITGILQSVNETQLQTDMQGFARVYREKVSIKIYYHKRNGKTKTFVLSNYYDFTVDADSLVSQSRKDEAIKIAISKALTDLFSKIAINSLK